MVIKKIALGNQGDSKIILFWGVNMRLFNKLFVFLATLITTLVTCCTIVFAETESQLNLADWKSITLADDKSSPYPVWKLNDTKTAVTQTVNARPSALISDIECNNNKIEGSFSVDTTEDDDFIGFVFGYKDIGHYYLFDWKENQGMSVKLINSDESVKEDELWSSTGSGDRIKILYYNNISYLDETVYNFILNFTDKGIFSIAIKQGDKVLDEILITDNTYTSGKFGFYNCSQSMVTYSGFTKKISGPVLHVKSSEVNSELSLDWSTVDGAASYIVKRSSNPEGPYTTIASGITGTTYTDTYVISGSTYYYIITAILNGSESLDSNKASATTAVSTADKRALLIINMQNGERKEYELALKKVNDFMIWYNNNPTSNPTYAIEKDYNRASFTSRKDYISYNQIVSVEVDEYNN
jgi:hypothetical protein